MSLTVIGVKSKLKTEKFDLFEGIVNSISTKTSLENGDILIISSKYVSNSQGRLIDFKNVIPTHQAKRIASQFVLSPKIAEVIVRESDMIFGGIPGFVISSSDQILAPNAGIDKSNIKNGKIILYPGFVQLVAEQLRRKFFLKFSLHLGIIISDSRLMPGRIGTTGIALACAGIEPTSDMRAQKDLYGKSLKVTFQAIADNLSSIANLTMGEGSEATPIVVIKNTGIKIADRKIGNQEMSIPYEQCIYVRGFSMPNFSHNF